MNTQRTTVLDLYRTDLERYLFAPARQRGRPWHVRRLAAAADWLRDWLASGWTRCRAFAEAHHV